MLVFVKPINLCAFQSLEADQRRIRTRAIQCSSPHLRHGFHRTPNSQKPLVLRTLLARVANDGDGDGRSADVTSQQSLASDNEEMGNSSSLGDSYVSLFVRMLGLDNDPLDREQAIVALWKYSLGGKKSVDAIMQFRGCINLTISLLRSDLSSSCEAACGLLRSISMFNPYKELVAESGAIEEITGLLSRPSLNSQVKEQSLGTLWNLSVDEKLRLKIASVDLLPILVGLLDDDDIKVKEAAGGILSNLALTKLNHKIMVEEGAIPKLAKLLKNYDEGSKVTRKEAKNALLKLCKDDFYKILIIEEGLIPVPLIGKAAYKSLEPGPRAWPSFPDGSQIERVNDKPSRFGASELLLGLNVDGKNVNIDEAKMNAIVGHTQQLFLARIGAIEVEEELSSGQRCTLLPWVDGVARLTLILGMTEEAATSRAADCVAEASINEEMRIAFREAGAVKHLIRLLGYNNMAVKLPVVRALERLSISNGVCEVIEAGALDSLVETLRFPDISPSLQEKVLDILARIFDPSKILSSTFNDASISGSNKGEAGDLPRKYIQETNARENLLDSAAILCLVEILNTSRPNLQRKAASILEFVANTKEIRDVMVNSMDIETCLDAVFGQKVLDATDSDFEGTEPERYTLEIEEAGLVISAAARLFTKLLDSSEFCRRIDQRSLTERLRHILKSGIPLHYKDWVAACLVKLGSLSGSLSGPKPDLKYSIYTEVTLYETIPRLTEQLKTSSSLAAKEAAAVELYRIISEGVVDSTRAVASEGVIRSLVKLIEEGSEKAVEAGLAILYSLSMEGENHAGIVGAGAVPVLKRIVLSQRPQWSKALHLLRTLPT